MRLSQIQLPFRAAASSLLRPTVPLAGEIASRLRIDIRSAPVDVTGKRFASVKAQGQYKLTPKRTIPKKLGAKRTGDQYVIPGNILYKQRGTHWWPGENCIMGRDHTIHAMASGYVKYYRDPHRHPDRKYIGVVFDKADTLPYPVHAERKRRLGMTAHAIVSRVPEPQLSPSGIPTQVVRAGAPSADGKSRGPSRVLRLRDDYSYREDNWRVGRLAKLEGVTKTKGGRGPRASRSARFRSKRWRREQHLAGLRKSRDARRDEAGEVDEWTLAAQRRQQEERSKKASAEKAKSKKKAEKQAKQRMAGMKKTAQKKAQS